MNTDQADSLAVLITKTWRNSPPPDIWAEELLPLGANRAEAAYRKLRREAERTPTIAWYLATYNAMPVSFLDEPYEWTPQVRREDNAISYAEYMDLLVVRAGNGDAPANEMLDIWADNEARGLSLKKLDEKWTGTP